MILRPEVKAAWLEDLRSGRYLQGQGALHYKTNDGDKLCCLGVLCEQAVKAGVIPPPRCNDNDYEYGADRTTAILPPEVAEWAFLDADDESCNPIIKRISLSDWNDHQDADFGKIADLIEARL